MRSSTTTSVTPSTTPKQSLRAALTPGALFGAFANWLVIGQHALFSFSLVRILYALAMLIVLIPSLPDRHYLWGVGSAWIEPEAKRRGWWEIFRVLFSKDNAVLFDIAYGFLIVLVLVVLVGWKTKWVLPITLLFWVGLSSNSTLLTNGGDVIMRITMLFMLFANLTEHLSIDSWIRKRRAARGIAPAVRRGLAKALAPTWLSTTLHNTVLILCCYQIILVYVNSAIFKLMGDEWVDGSAVYYAVVIESFRAFPVLSDLVWQSTFAVQIGSWVSIYVQLLFPVLLLWRPTRYAALVVIMGMHLSIALLLGLWPFSLAMIALDLLFVRDSSWRKLGAFLRDAGLLVYSLLGRRTLPASYRQSEDAAAPEAQFSASEARAL